MKFLLQLACGIAFLTAAEAKTAQPERWYQERVAAVLQGKMEVRVEDGRVDVLTGTHAIEVEFAAKWKNSIGQALWYAMQTNKAAGIVIVIEDAKRDRPDAIRLGSLIASQKLPIKLWLWPDDFVKPKS
ncbi:MAG: hypothetical protein EOP88_17135 [Verrucomicrobiaceae bacterium]|nr:MAG: hypothetical protein EOP88_17135 [Verrucomicrobiaceae bacterium]